MQVMPIIRPTLPTFREFEELVRPGWEEGTVTTGSVVRLRAGGLPADRRGRGRRHVVLYGRTHAGDPGAGAAGGSRGHRAVVHVCGHRAGARVEWSSAVACRTRSRWIPLTSSANCRRAPQPSVPSTSTGSRRRSTRCSTWELVMGFPCTSTVRRASGRNTGSGRDLRDV
jgi:hypothetical protein